MPSPATVPVPVSDAVARGDTYTPNPAFWLAVVASGLLVGGLENVFQLYRGVTERDLYVMLLLFVFLVFRPRGLFAVQAARD